MTGSGAKEDMQKIIKEELLRPTQPVILKVRPVVGSTNKQGSEAQMAEYKTLEIPFKELTITCNGRLVWAMLRIFVPPQQI